MVSFFIIQVEILEPLQLKDFAPVSDAFYFQYYCHMERLACWEGMRGGGGILSSKQILDLLT